MGSHSLRAKKWEEIRHNLERSTELLNEILDLAEELREDYSYSQMANERLEKLTEISASIEEALKKLEETTEIIDD